MSKAVVDILGDGVLMYQSDYPHPESLFPAAVDTVLEWKSVLGEPATRKLMGENAMRFLRLESTPWDTAAQPLTAGASASSGI
jgi:predicted TIM-barrel fold metal-dependent hydrolase